MKYRQIDQSPKTFVLVFETGDEVGRSRVGYRLDQAPAIGGPHDPETQ
jgi:hypothetical protein